MINSAVVDLLQPFIVTSWHGHRNDAEIPAAVRDVWQEKFAPQPGRRLNRQSNVDLAVFDSKGRLVHWFDGMPRDNRGRFEALDQYTLRELRKASIWLGMIERQSKKLPLKLPDLNPPTRGIRVFVSLKDDRMTAYRAPVVEVVPLDDQGWKPLAYSTERRTVDAAALKPWLSQIYPPGVMERTNPETKTAYQIKTVEGKLSLTPIDADGRHRSAILSGNIRLTDEGRDAFSYTGQLEVVLTYDANSSTVKTLRGVFDGIYPRFDAMHDRTRQLPLQAVFESRPEFPIGVGTVDWFRPPLPPNRT
ncbi:MAG: hypothetical protein O3A00_15865, partial [Planctomycetota bacterium]|nr:hypothetical protein [Planctomycetota bacterium]